MATDQNEIKRFVQERYGARARGVIELSETQSCDSEDAGCCGPSDFDRALRLYNEGQVTGIPAEAVAASAGCGNPTALAGLKPGERVLDLGSGGGIDCFLAAQQVGDTGYVTGLDMTPDMLELARRNLETTGLNNVEFVKGEMENIPLPDASVDVVISNCVICLSPDKDAVFPRSLPGVGAGGTGPRFRHGGLEPGWSRGDGCRSLGCLRGRGRGQGGLPGPDGPGRIRRGGNYRRGRAV